jgi:hypothetical protein
MATRRRSAFVLQLRNATRSSQAASVRRSSGTSATVTPVTTRAVVRDCGPSGHPCQQVCAPRRTSHARRTSAPELPGLIAELASTGSRPAASGLLAARAPASTGAAVAETTPCPGRRGLSGDGASKWISSLAAGPGIATFSTAGRITPGSSARWCRVRRECARVPWRYAARLSRRGTGRVPPGDGPASPRGALAVRRSAPLAPVAWPLSNEGHADAS